jgi:hypothetical protein
LGLSGGVFSPGQNGGGGVDNLAIFLVGMGIGGLLALVWISWRSFVAQPDVSPQTSPATLTSGTVIVRRRVYDYAKEKEYQK